LARWNDREPVTNVPTTCHPERSEGSAADVDRLRSSSRGSVPARGECWRMCHPPNGRRHRWTDVDSSHRLLRTKRRKSLVTNDWPSRASRRMGTFALPRATLGRIVLFRKRPRIRGAALRMTRYGSVCAIVESLQQHRRMRTFALPRATLGRFVLFYKGRCNVSF